MRLKVKMHCVKIATYESSVGGPPQNAKMKDRGVHRIVSAYNTQEDGGKVSECTLVDRCDFASIQTPRMGASKCKSDFMCHVKW